MAEFSDKLISVAECDPPLLSSSLQLHHLQGAKVSLTGGEIHSHMFQRLFTITLCNCHQTSGQVINNKKIMISSRVTMEHSITLQQAPVVVPTCRGLGLQPGGLPNCTPASEEICTWQE